MVYPKEILFLLSLQKDRPYQGTISCTYAHNDYLFVSSICFLTWLYESYLIKMIVNSVQNILDGKLVTYKRKLILDAVFVK